MVNSDFVYGDFCVLMCVYSGDDPVFFHDALVSVWDSQTLRPKQIVVVVDGYVSVDLHNVLSRWTDRLGPIFTVVFLDVNVGLAAALNQGLHFCKFDIVARMDADDISLPNRFEVQYRFMISRLEIVACSGHIVLFDPKNPIFSGVRLVPIGKSAVSKFAKLRSPLSHPATMFRKNVVLSVGGYPNFRKSQDYALWSLLAVSGFDLDNIDQFILKMRSGSELVARRGFQHFLGEFALLRFQRSIGFINFFEFTRNVFLRFVFRSSPKWIRALFYG